MNRNIHNFTQETYLGKPYDCTIFASTLKDIPRQILLHCDGKLVFSAYIPSKPIPSPYKDIRSIVHAVLDAYIYESKQEDLRKILRTS